MKRKIGIALIVVFGILTIYLWIIGIVWIACFFAAITGAGFTLAAMRDFTIISSELKEENGVSRLHVTVKNNQKRPTVIWFVANIYYNGASVGLVNSSSLMLDSFGTGELVATLQLPIQNAKAENISWKIVKWNFK